MNINSLLYNPSTFFLIAAFIIYSIIANKSFVPSKRYIYKDQHFNLTWYGLFVGLSFVLMMFYAFNCGLSIKKVFFVLLMGFTLMWLGCRECRKEYQFIAFYTYFIPIAMLVFTPREMVIFLTGMALSNAVGRLGCVSAGCCHGKLVSCAKISTQYNDSSQIINQKLNRSRTCTTPSALIESTIQFIVVGLCLLFPSYGIPIFATGNVLLILLSVKLRKSHARNNPAMAILSLAVLLVWWYLTSGKNNLDFLAECNMRVPIYWLMIPFIFIFLITSNDINITKIKKLINESIHNYLQFFFDDVSNERLDVLA